jgi:hypothetical protein
MLERESFAACKTLILSIGRIKAEFEKDTAMDWAPLSDKTADPAF